jgi:hypothetical protein
MKKLFPLVPLCVAVMMWSAGEAGGDTRAPSTQTFVLDCGGTTVTVVSPVFSARAGQVVGTTGVGILQQVVFGDGGRDCAVRATELPGSEAIGTDNLYPAR